MEEKEEEGVRRRVMRFGWGWVDLYLEGEKEETRVLRWVMVASSPVIGH